MHGHQFIQTQNLDKITLLIFPLPLTSVVLQFFLFSNGETGPKILSLLTKLWSFNSFIFRELMLHSNRIDSISGNPFKGTLVIVSVDFWLVNGHQGQQTHETTSRILDRGVW